MKKLLLCLPFILISIVSFSCSGNQDDANLIRSNTPTPASLEITSTSTGMTPIFTYTLNTSATPITMPRPIKTLLPYWGAPVTSQFDAKWIVYENNEYGFSFKYPQPFDSILCGELIFNEHTDVSQLNFEKGGILIEFSHVGNLDINNYARDYADQFDENLITGIEQFHIGGQDAVRFIYSNQSSYAKKAFAIRNSRMYEFGFREGNYSECNNIEITEEQIYETIISTWEFLN